MTRSAPRRASSDAASDVSRWIRRNPYGALAGAIGVGFVVGGGLFTRLTARLVGAGVRMSVVAAVPLLREEVLRGLSQWVKASKDDAKPPASTA
ncbi:MAG: hypothetical protein JWM82_3442 [Myxococcales bacterium]|nr:hypothetical protein [Myxococcales bacterium]